VKTTEVVKLLEIAIQGLIEECYRGRAERDEALRLYHDLLMQVERKSPHESRHNAARRYITEHPDNAM
jgi:hypothetical protein